MPRKKAESTKIKAKKALQQASKKKGSLPELAYQISQIANYSIHEAAKEFHSSFLKQVTDSIGNYVNFVLPEGTKLFKQTDSCIVLAIEHKPSVRSLYFDIDGEYKRFNLALPFVILLPIFAKSHNKWKLCGMGVAYKNEPIQSPSDMLLVPNLPNLHNQNYSRSKSSEGECPTYYEMCMCLGHDLSLKSFSLSKDPLSIAKICTDLNNHFFGSTFNKDLRIQFDRYSYSHPEFFGSLYTWERKSKEDPFFPLKVNWFNGITIENFMDTALKKICKDRDSIKKKVADFVSKIYREAFTKFIVDSSEFQESIISLTSEEVSDVLSYVLDCASDSLNVISSDTVRDLVVQSLSDSIESAINKRRS